jgi:Fe-S cluster assembly ATP-binding protein
VAGQEILRGVDLEVRSGEVHALMGPNGSGKSTLSHVLMGRDDYAVTQGSVTIDGAELLGLPTHERAALGLFLALQYPVELPGVRIDDFLEAALRGQGREPDGLHARVTAEAERLGVARQFLERGLNVEFSGGEQKRGENLQLAVLRPKFAVLDEIDSGLDVDALRDVARRVEAMTNDDDLGVLAITHYARLLDELRPDVVHVLMGGRVVKTGGPELAQQLEETGYEGLAAALGVEATTPRPTIPRRPCRLLNDPRRGLRAHRRAFHGADHVRWARAWWSAHAVRTPARRKTASHLSDGDRYVRPSPAARSNLSDQDVAGGGRRPPCRDPPVDTDPYPEVRRPRRGGSHSPTSAACASSHAMTRSLAV